MRIKPKEVFNRFVEKSAAIVVLNETTRALVKQYGVPAKKVKLIPHGCPDLPLDSKRESEAYFGLKNKVVLSTFGLLSKGKGIEYVIEALPEIVKKDPRIVYYVLGRHSSASEKTRGSLPKHAYGMAKESWATRTREVP